MNLSLSSRSRMVSSYPVVLALGVGSFLIVYKAALQRLPPLVLLSVVMLGTALMYGGFLCLNKTDKFKFKKKELGLLLLLGLCATVLNAAMIWAIDMSETSQVSLLLRSDIIFSALIGTLFFGERVTRSGLSGLLLMGIGSLLVLGLLPSQVRVISTGDLLALLTGLLLSTNAVIIKYGLARVPDRVIVFCNSGVVFILSFTMVLLGGSLESYMTLQSPLTTCLTLLAILFSVVTFWLYYVSLALHPVWVVRAFLLLSPFVTMVLSGWILEETVYWTQWLGGIFLAGGGTVLLRDIAGEARTASKM